MAKQKKRVSESEKFLKMVMSDQNVKAKEKLEKILKEKVARRIKDTLAS